MSKNTACIYEISSEDNREIEFIATFENIHPDIVRDTVNDLWVIENCRDELIGYASINNLGVLLEIKYTTFENFENYSKDVFNALKSFLNFALFKNWREYELYRTHFDNGKLCFRNTFIKKLERLKQINN